MNQSTQEAKTDSRDPLASWPLKSAVWTSLLLAFVTSAGADFALAAEAYPAPNPVVEAEENVYAYEPANNGAGPLWCHGSTCLVRIGKEVFASGLETITNAKPLNNCRWTLFQRTEQGWVIRQTDLTGRTREPCPMGGFTDGHLYLTANPTLTAPDTYAGPARPELLEFSAGDTRAAFRRLLPVWEGTPRFTEHSYRSFAVDGPGRELILFQNIDYTHAEWTFRDRSEKWAAQGKLRWPAGAPGPKSEPIRVCYPNVALRNRAVHFCGVSDIVEPNLEWRAFKRQLSGQQWDYDFRRLFYTWTPDITREPFQDWVEIASRDATCGWISPGDLWVASDGAAHIVWTERAIDERLRPRFFPDARQSHSLNYAIVRRGKSEFRRVLFVAEEGKPGVVASAPRFQPAPDNRLFMIYYASGTEASGQAVSENRLIELYPDGGHSPPVKVPLKQPFAAYFTATVRGGSPPSKTLELLGERSASPRTISYARVRLF